MRELGIILTIATLANSIGLAYLLQPHGLSFLAAFPVALCVGILFIYHILKS